MGEVNLVAGCMLPLRLLVQALMVEEKPRLLQEPREVAKEEVGLYIPTEMH